MIKTVECASRIRVARLFFATALVAVYIYFEATVGYGLADGVFVRATVMVLLLLMYLGLHWATRGPARIVCVLDFEAGRIEVMHSGVKTVSLPISEIILMGMSVAYRDANKRLVWLPLRDSDFRAP